MNISKRNNEHNNILMNMKKKIKERKEVYK